MNYKLIIDLLLGPIAIYFLIGFILVSYFIIFFLTRSFVKPLKYLGFGFILSGVLSICTKAIFVFNPHDKSVSSLFKLIAEKGTTSFMKYGSVLLLIGIICLVIYYIITIKNIKNKKVLENGEK